MNNITVFEEHELLSNWFVDEPLISIVCTSYNHELFIRDALNGFFGQIIKYPFEVIIHDDASTDDTQEIIKEYVDKYPKIIKPILQLENQWMGKGISGTTKFAFPAARGKYIAWCEGDDYWTDRQKITKQLDFMDSNESCSFCFSNVFHVDECNNGLSINWPNRNENFIITKRMLGEEYLIPSPTIFFKSSFLNTRSMVKLKAAPLGDYLVSSLLLLRGNGFYCPDKMATYCHHKNGVFSELELHDKVRAGLETRRILFRFFMGKARLVSALILFKNSRIFKKRYRF